MLDLHAAGVTNGKRNLFLAEKIVIGGLTRRIEAALCCHPLAVGVGVYCVTDWHVDPRFLLAVLNSEFVSRWYQQRYCGKSLAGGYLAINAGQLETIPIPRAAPSVQHDLGRQVEMTMALRYGKSKGRAATAVPHRPASGVAVRRCDR